MNTAAREAPAYQENPMPRARGSTVQVIAAVITAIGVAYLAFAQVAARVEASGQKQAENRVETWRQVMSAPQLERELMTSGTVQFPERIYLKRFQSADVEDLHDGALTVKGIVGAAQRSTLPVWYSVRATVRIVDDGIAIEPGYIFRETQAPDYPAAQIK